MKKLLLTVAAIFGIAIILTGCPGPAGGDDNKQESRHQVSGKFGTWSAPYEVGDIIFSDGSATPYTTDLELTDAQKAAAIAVIYYKGTGLNSDNSNKVRTLGVGLKQAQNRWCTDDAKAYDITVSTITCNRTGEGINMTFSGDLDGSDNLEQIAQFLKTAENRYDDTTTERKYPGFYFAKNYKNTETAIEGTQFENGWFIPSVAEMYEIYKCRKDQVNGFDVNSAITKCGESIICNDNIYWTSTDHPSVPELAYNLKMYSSLSFAPEFPRTNPVTSKSNQSYYVFAIREF